MEGEFDRDGEVMNPSVDFKRLSSILDRWQNVRYPSSFKVEVKYLRALLMIPKFKELLFKLTQSGVADQTRGVGA